MAAPPKLLFWLTVGLFTATIIGSIAGIFVFRNVLRPCQQQRIIALLPFMENLLPPRPDPGSTLPTPVAAQNGDLSPQDLLEAPLTAPGTVVGPSATPTVTLAPTITLSPTAEPTLFPTTIPTQTERVELPGQWVAPLPPSARMNGFRHVQQTWNNCGLASITIALSYFGWTESQEVAAAFLKPDPEDKNVTWREMVSFVNDQAGMRAVTRMGGTLELLKTFIAGDFPVIIAIGYMPEGYDWLGHYQTLVSYDAVQQVFYLYDSFLGTGENGEGIAEPFRELDSNWQHFNRTFIVLYEQEREQRVREILGDLADLTLVAEYALAVAQEEARANPQNGFAWFNIGTSLTALKRYDEAAVAYD